MACGAADALRATPLEEAQSSAVMGRNAAALFRLNA
jgi:hypothetical protein